MNLYINGEIETSTLDGTNVTFVTETEYPKTGDVKVNIKLQGEKQFNLKLRNPHWSKRTMLS